jgi:hypothetical protein
MLEAFVVSVEQLVAALLRSEQAGWHGPNAVADPHVPMTWWEVCPAAAPRVSVLPEMVQVSQFAPVAEQELAPGDGAGKTLPPNCALPSCTDRPTRMAHNGTHTICLEICFSGFVMTCCSLLSAAPSRWSGS